VGEGDFLIRGFCQNREAGKPCDEASGIAIVNNAFRGFRRAGEFRNKELARSGDLVSPIFAANGVVREVHHNLYFHLDVPFGDLHGQCPSGPGDVCGNPGFASDVLSERFDGRLRAGSPALHAGIAVPGVTADHDGNPRPAGSAPDIGAFAGPVNGEPAGGEPLPGAPAPVPATATSFQFDFGSGAAAPGYTKVLANTVYTDDLGYGFEDVFGLRAVNRRGSDPLRDDFITSDKPPFYFSVKVPEEGNYKVTVTFGDRDGESTTTVKAELRRLMVEKAVTRRGEFTTRTFVVNVRRPQISTGGEVKMGGYERLWEARGWDNKLTLEFTNARPAICGIEIAKADAIPTIYIAGDSTVADQAQEPFASWGQMITAFFKPDIAVANFAESGASLKSFMAENRLAKVMSRIKPGDYLFIQMGANDQKESGLGIGPFTSYKADLKRFVAETRRRGATPVLVTPVHRLIFGADGKFVDTLGDYPEAVRQTAREENVPLIDMNAMSRTLFEALGPKTIAKASADGSHENNYGSYELAKCMVEEIRKAKLPMAPFLLDLPPFNPAHPDPVEQFELPTEPYF
jgi:lysophospholipase L1-like esterase